MHQVSERNLVSTYRLTPDVRTALSGSVVATHAGRPVASTYADAIATVTSAS